MESKRRELATHAVDEGEGKSIGIRLTKCNSWPLELRVLAGWRGLIANEIYDSRPDVCFFEYPHEHRLNARDNCLRMQEC